MPGPEVVARLRERRPGALFNEGFAKFIGSHGGTGASRDKERDT